jgi:pyruvate ferredoxin oxidoreductase beta subunit
MTITLKSLPDDEFVALGRGGCSGCGAVIAARMATKVLGKRTIMVNATSCMVANYCYVGAPLFPYLHGLFENTGALLSGIDTGLKVLNKRDGINLVGLAGDGGTADIGLQSLSGAVERGHKFLYICYDNEAYQNTGIQRSGTTPYAAITSTTPLGKNAMGEARPLFRKDMVRIMAAHKIPYAATASISHPLDYLRKVQRATEIDGPSYIHVLSPCPLGWGFPENLTIKIARLAVETCFFPIYEVENGTKFRLNVDPKEKKPVEEYLKLQGRFRHLFKEEFRELIGKIQEAVNTNWEYLKKLCSS